MKTLFNNADIFDYDLPEKIRESLVREISNFDTTLQYSYALRFAESLIYDKNKMEGFVIPEEARAPYLRGKVTNGRDKIDELLSYQLHATQKEIESLGLNVRMSEVQGTPFINLDNIEIEIERYTREENEERPKRGRDFKVSVIMPSITGFLKNVEKVCEEFENEKNRKLESAFGGKGIYDQYKNVLDSNEMYKVYNSFQEQYGDMWVYSKDYGESLRNKFIQSIEVQAGIIKEKETVEMIQTPLILPEKFIYAIPAYKMTKTKRRSRKNIGYIKILTNGRIVRVQYEGSMKEMVMLPEKLNECYFGASEKDNNNKLIYMLEALINKTELVCNEAGCSLEREGIENVLSCLDLKRALKRAREA